MRSPAARGHPDGDTKNRPRKIAEDHYSGVLTVATVWLVFYSLVLAAAIWTLLAPDASQIAARHTAERSHVSKNAASPQPSTDSHTAQIRR